MQNHSFSTILMCNRAKPLVSDFLFGTSFFPRWNYFAQQSGRCWQLQHKCLALFMLTISNRNVKLIAYNKIKIKHQVAFLGSRGWGGVCWAVAKTLISEGNEIDPRSRNQIPPRSVSVDNSFLKFNQEDNFCKYIIPTMYQ